jgi:hypothetical protein
MGTDAYGTFAASYQTGTTFSTTWDVIHTVPTTELHSYLSLSSFFSDAPVPRALCSEVLCVLQVRVLAVRG